MPERHVYDFLTCIVYIMKYIQGASFPGTLAVQKSIMREGVFGMSFEVYIEEVEMEMEEYLG